MADPFSVFTAGRLGERAIESRRFQQKIGLQERGLGLQERGLGIQEERLGLETERLGIDRAAAETKRGDEARKRALSSVDNAFDLKHKLDFFSGNEGFEPDENFISLANMADRAIKDFIPLAGLSSDEAQARFFNRRSAIRKELAETAGQGQFTLGETRFDPFGRPVAGAGADPRQRLRLPEARPATNLLTGDISTIDVNDPVAVAAAQRAGIAQTPFSVQAETAGGLTRTETTRNQEILRQAGEISTSIEALRPFVSGETVGVPGLVRAISNVTAAQFDDRFFFEDRAKFEELAGLLREASLRTVSADNRFNKDDRVAISKLFPSAGAFESAASANTKLSLLQQVFTQRGAAAAGRLAGDTAPITAETLGFLLQNNLISESDAAQFFRLFQLEIK